MEKEFEDDFENYVEKPTECSMAMDVKSTMAMETHINVAFIWNEILI